MLILYSTSNNTHRPYSRGEWGFAQLLFVNKIVLLRISGVIYKYDFKGASAFGGGGIGNSGGATLRTP